MRSSGTDVYGRHAPELLHDSVALGTAGAAHREQDAADLVASGRFDDPEHLAFEHRRAMSVAVWLDELFTHSPHVALEAGRADRLSSELRSSLESTSGGAITVRYETVGTTCRARPDSAHR